MEPFNLYTCHSAICRGAVYAVTQQPLSCPYCDRVALEDEPTAEIIYMSVKQLPEENDE